MTKRLPPFGAELAKLAVDDGDIYVATAWNLAKGRRRIVVPQDLEISELNLGFLAGRSVLLVHRSNDSEERMVALVKAILAARPRRVIAIDVDAKAVAFLRVAAPEQAAA